MLSRKTPHPFEAGTLWSRPSTSRAYSCSTCRLSTTLSGAAATRARFLGPSVCFPAGRPGRQQAVLTSCLPPRSVVAATSRMRIPTRSRTAHATCFKRDAAAAVFLLPRSTASMPMPPPCQQPRPRQVERGGPGADRPNGRKQARGFLRRWRSGWAGPLLERSRCSTAGRESLARSPFPLSPGSSVERGWSFVFRVRAS